MAPGGGEDAGEVGSSAGGPTVAELLVIIQEQVFQRRLRAKDAFADFDRLRCGRCTQQQFERAVRGLCPNLLEDQEVQLLADHYTEQTGRYVKWPQVVSYTRFYQDVDAVFGLSGLEKRPGCKVPVPGASLPCTAGFVPAPVAAEDSDQLEETLKRIAVLAETRGIELFSCFQDCQRPGSATSVFPRGSGKVGQQWFMQRFPFINDISENDLQLLLDRYRTELDGFHVFAFVKDVAARRQDRRAERQQPPPLRIRPMSAGSALSRSSSASSRTRLSCNASQANLSCRDTEVVLQRPQSAASLRAPPLPDGGGGGGHSGGGNGGKPAAGLLPRRPLSALSRNPKSIEAIPRIDILTKLKAAVAERRLRPSGCFQDFDRLRKGTCTASQLKAAFTLLGLAVDAESFSSVFELYRTEDGKFRYPQFCAEVSELPGEPSRPPSAGMQSLRYKARLEAEDRAKLEELRDQLRAKIRLRRTEIRSTFLDACKRCGIAPAGHVTSSQFARIADTLGFQLGDEQVELLCQAYCDSDDGTNFNYLKFCDDVDPRDGAPPPPPSSAASAGERAGSTARSAPRPASAASGAAAQRQAASLRAGAAAAAAMAAEKASTAASVPSVAAAAAATAAAVAMAPAPCRIEPPTYFDARGRVVPRGSSAGRLRPGSAPCRRRMAW